MSQPIRNNKEIHITGDWKLLSGKLKARFSELTEADVAFRSGEENDLIRRIGKRLNKRHDEVILLLQSMGNVKWKKKRSRIFIFPIHW